MSETITVTLRHVEGLTGNYVNVTAWGIRNGRYGSIAGVTLYLDEAELPGDPEELLSLALSAVSAVVYS